MQNPYTRTGGWVVGLHTPPIAALDCEAHPVQSKSNNILVTCVMYVKDPCPNLSLVLTPTVFVGEAFYF